VALTAMLAGCAEGGLTGNLSDLLGERSTPAPVEGESKTLPEATPPDAAAAEPATPKLDPAVPDPAAPEPAASLEPGTPARPLPTPDFVMRPIPEPVGPSLIRPPITGPQPLRIALLLPLSGTQKALGRALLDSALLALFDVAPERLTLMPRDTGGTAEGAARSAEDVLGEGAEIILGPVFSQAVQAAAEPARKREVNVVAFSTDRSIAGNGVYLMGFMADQQVDRVMDYAGSQGIRRYASLVPMTRYGDHIIAQLATAANRHGGEIVRIERYAADEEVMEPAKRLAEYEGRRAALAARRQELSQSEDPDAAAELEELENAETLGDVDFEAVMLPEGGARLRAVAPLLPFYDVHPDKVRFLGTGLWDDDSIGREPALVGGWFAGPDPNLGKAFRARFEEIYGYRPPRIASLAYDAVALAAILSSGGQRPDYTAEALTDPSGFAGADGLFRFRSDGIAERGLAVVEVQPRGLKVLDPAPNSFTAGGS